MDLKELFQVISEDKLNEIFKGCTVTFNTNFDTSKTFNPSVGSKISISRALAKHLDSHDFHKFKIVKIELTEENKIKLYKHLLGE